MSYVLSPNMSLPVPTVGSENGPQYAIDINDCMQLLDQHDHSSGSGVPITPNGLNINADLDINDNNLTALRSIRFQAQPSALVGVSDLGCLYETGVDLYYRDGNGNNIRITQSGGIAGPAGSITNLVAPASATYVPLSSTFVWQSNVNTPANMDGASFILRNLVANSKGMTLQPPAAMATDYIITLPVPPASGNSFVMMDNAGTTSASVQVDNASIEVASSTLRVKAQGIQQAMMAARSTGTTVGAGGVAISTPVTASYGSSSTNTFGTVTITTTGRPVFVGLQCGTPAASSGIRASSTIAAGPTYTINFYRGATLVSAIIGGIPQVNVNATSRMPGSAFTMVDIVAAGTYTYTVEAVADAYAGTFDIDNLSLIAYEL